MSRIAFFTSRRLVLLGLGGAVLAACEDRPPPQAAAPAQPATPPAAPPPPVLPTTADGRPIISFGNLRYAVRPPLGWRLKPLLSRAEQGRPDDLVALAAPADAADPVAADTQINLEAFRKSERAPSFEAKVENIARDRRRLREDFKIDRELPLVLAGNRRAHLYLMRNVPSGDSEAVAFVDEGEVVAEMVLVAKVKGVFDQTLPLFREMVRTYQRIP